MDTKFFSSVSVFQNPAGDARTGGNTEAQRAQIGKGMGGREQCETEKSAVETQSLHNPTLCSLCLCVSNSGRDARTRETQRHRGHRSEGNSVKRNSAAGADWIETQSLYNPTLCSLCLCVSNSVQDARTGETQRHRGHRSGRERVEWDGRIMELETAGLGIASLVLRSMQPPRFPFLRNASHLIPG